MRAAVLAYTAALVKKYLLLSKSIFVFLLESCFDYLLLYVGTEVRFSCLFILISHQRKVYSEYCTENFVQDSTRRIESTFSGGSFVGSFGYRVDEKVNNG